MNFFIILLTERGDDFDWEALWNAHAPRYRVTVNEHQSGMNKTIEILKFFL
jgi:hypothetical protein